MAPKEEPAAKKAKTEEEVKEEPKEQEQDDKTDERPSIKDTPITFETADTSLNVVPVNGGKVLMLMSDGGMQFLVAGARANVGMKTGRYYYEVNIVESLSHFEGKDNWSQSPAPKQLVKVGFSTAGSSLILGDTADGVGFDSAGNFLAEKKSKKAGQAFHKGQTVGVLLNLDAKSPNANTVSLFRDGERISPPQALPEQLKGKVLFPHVSFRNVSVHVHFGPTPMFALPFKCRTLQQAATADVQTVKAAVPKDGKYDVMFPVGFPDEGTFTWLDMFLEKNPQYVELSDRAIQAWIVKSGIWKPKSGDKGKNSNDRPEYNFGLGLVDDASIRRSIMAMAPLVPRHYVVMEVKQNLVASDRTENIKRFNLPHFKKIAKVMMGEPKADYKERVHVQVLQDKQLKADNEWRKQKAEKERKRAAAKRQKELKAKQAAAEEEAKKRKEAADAKRKEAQEALAAKKKAAEDAKKKEAGEEVKDVEMKPEEKKEEPKEEPKKEEPKEEAKEEAKEEEEEDDDMGTEPPKIALTDEDKKINFRVPAIKDLADNVLNRAFGQFSIPAKSEGFDEVKFEWQSEAQSIEYLKKWRLEKKLACKIEDLQAGEWFKTTLAEFQKTAEEYRTKQKAFKAKKPKAVAKPKDGEEEEPKKEDVDLFEVEDVCDIGNGEPLFSNFSFEDWTLFALRYELFLLMEGFKKDVDDAERVGIPESHFMHYYSRYFKKSINIKAYGKDNVRDLCEFVKDTASVDTANGVLVCNLEAGASRDISGFVKLQEENRRERQRRLDAGDESVRINFEAMHKQIEAEKQRVLQAAANAERQKKQAEEREKAKKVAEDAAAKAKLDAAKKAALGEKAKPAAQTQAAKPAQTAAVKWNSKPAAAQQAAKPVPWNSNKGGDKGAKGVQQTAWGSDKGAKGGNAATSWQSQVAKYESSKGASKGGGKGKW